MKTSLLVLSHAVSQFNLCDWTVQSHLSDVNRIATSRPVYGYLCEMSQKGKIIFISMEDDYHESYLPAMLGQGEQINLFASEWTQSDVSAPLSDLSIIGGFNDCISDDVSTCMYSLKFLIGNVFHHVDFYISFSHLHGKWEMSVYSNVPLGSLSSVFLNLACLMDGLPYDNLIAVDAREDLECQVNPSNVVGVNCAKLDLYARKQGF